jgi:hypothetical protein
MVVPGDTPGFVFRFYLSGRVFYQSFSEKTATFPDIRERMEINGTNKVEMANPICRITV